MAISKETMERIGKDAIAHGGNPHQYAAGATAEAEKAQCLIEALDKICDWNKSYLQDTRKIATAALQSYTNSLK